MQSKATLDDVVGGAVDHDPQETSEWLEAWNQILAEEQPERAAYLLRLLSERARAEGVDIGGVLLAFTAAIDRAEALVAHNMSFDEPVMGAEFLRAGLGNPVPMRPRVCTMERSTDFCQLPGKYGYKWPTLDELHRTLFEQSVDGAHRALVDVRACARCFFELRRRQVL